MKASEARKDWKNVLDRAAQGEVIQIERGGVIYWLKAMVNVLPPGGKWLETDEVSSNVRPNIQKIKKSSVAMPQMSKAEKDHHDKNKAEQDKIDSILQSFMAEKKMKFCVNGHAIPDGRSKCMGKGCKYA